MHHFFVDKKQISEMTIRITGSDVNHIANVLRMKIGEKLLISDQVEKDYLCEIETIESDQVWARIIEVQDGQTELPARIYLFQGLPKSDKMELIIQKAVELGVYQIIPVTTKRTIVKLDAKKEENKRKRWNHISESAAKQSKRLLIPEVTKTMSLPEAYEYSQQFSINFIPYEEETDMKATKERLNQVKAGMQIGIFIGPEGGFDRQEILAAKESGILPITLGKRILRTETAGLTILSILMFLLES